MNVLNSAPKPNDVPLEPGPTDSVTRIEFNPVVDYLAVGSWDNQVSYGPPQRFRLLGATAPVRTRSSEVWY